MCGFLVCTMSAEDSDSGSRRKYATNERISKRKNVREGLDCGTMKMSKAGMTLLVQVLEALQRLHTVIILVPSVHAWMVPARQRFVGTCRIEPHMIICIRSIIYPDE
jgi:hypothetical protein